jgi:hypothetical protein
VAFAEILGESLEKLVSASNERLVLIARATKWLEDLSLIEQQGHDLIEQANALGVSPGQPFALEGLVELVGELPAWDMKMNLQAGGDAGTLEIKVYRGGQT